MMATVSMQSVPAQEKATKATEATTTTAVVVPDPVPEKATKATEAPVVRDVSGDAVAVKAPKATEAQVVQDESAEEETKWIVKKSETIQQGSFTFTRDEGCPGIDAKTVIQVAIDIGSCKGKAKGTISFVLNGVREKVSIDYPPTHDGMSTQFLSVNFTKTPTDNILKSAQHANVDYIQVGSDECTFQFGDLPKSNAGNSTGIRMVKAATSQSVLADAKNFASPNNEVIATHVKKGIEYPFINLGELPDSVPTANMSDGRRKYVILSHTIIVSKKIATVVAEVIATLAQRVAGTIGSLDLALEMLAAGVELYIVNAMPIGTPLMPYNDIDMKYDIEKELRHFFFMKDIAGFEIKTGYVDCPGAVQGKFFVRYTACTETIQGIAKCVNFKRAKETDMVCASFDAGHFTSQITVFAISGANGEEVIHMTNSGSESYGGLYLIQRAFNLYAKKAGIDPTAVIWGQKNDCSSATSNYNTLEKFLTSETGEIHTEHSFLMRSGNVKIASSELNAAFDEVAVEMISSLIKSLEDGHYFTLKQSAVRVLSFSGRLFRYRFKTNKYAGKMLAEAAFNQIKSLCENAGLAVEAIDIAQMGTEKNFQDVASAIANYSNNTPSGKLFAGPKSPIMHPTILIAEQYGTRQKYVDADGMITKTEQITTLKNYVVYDSTRRCAANLEFTLNQKTLGGTCVCVYLPIPISGVAEQKSVVSECTEQLSKGELNSNSKILVVPLFRIELPSKATSKIRLTFEMIGTFEAKVDIAFMTASGEMETTGPRLLVIPQPNLSRIRKSMFTRRGRELSFSQYRAARKEENEDSASTHLEATSVWTIAMPGECSHSNYMVKEDNHLLECSEIKSIEDSLIVPCMMPERVARIVSTVSLAPPPKSLKSVQSGFDKRHDAPSQKKREAPKKKKATKKRDDPVILIPDSDEEETAEDAEMLELVKNCVPESVEDEEEEAPKKKKKSREVVSEDEEEEAPKKKSQKKKSRKVVSEDEEEEAPKKKKANLKRKREASSDDEKEEKKKKDSKKKTDNKGKQRRKVEESPEKLVPVTRLSLGGKAPRKGPVATARAGHTGNGKGSMIPRGPSPRELQLQEEAARREERRRYMEEREVAMAPIPVVQQPTAPDAAQVFSAAIFESIDEEVMQDDEDVAHVAAVQYATLSGVGDLQPDSIPMEVVLKGNHALNQNEGWP